MGLFKKRVKKEEKSSTPKGHHVLTIETINHLTSDTVEIQLNVPSELASIFRFIPGQYLNFSIEINGKEERRSYSICSGKNESLAVAVKKIEKGIVSNWFKNSAVVGQEIYVTPPNGNFVLSKEINIVAIAAGSGITPILAIAKEIEASEDGKMTLFYGNKTENNIVFKSTLDGLKNTSVHHYLSQEEKEGCVHGRITKESFTEALKANLNLLKADGFYICGPEDLIFDMRDTLKLFGVAEEKIHFELFTTPTHHTKESHLPTSNFTGNSKVTVLIEGEEFKFDLEAKGKTILEKADKEGADVPYSCRGGVCSTCKAKVLSGKAVMDINYSLTDKEIEEGFILTCQSHPASDELTVTYDV